MAKKRLDQLLKDNFPQISRNKISSLIVQGKVKVDGVVITKAGSLFKEDAILNFDFEEPKYVSRAGFKLEKALNHFNINVKDLIVMDAGISTGGFSDCLLQHGVNKIYGVDVGYGQVHEKIRNDSRVILYERTNLRELENLPEKVDLITLDLSFISILKVIQSVYNLLKDNGLLIVLIKPQFEAGREQVGRGGIVSDPRIHTEVIKRVTEGIAKSDFKLIGYTDSPILGSSGNKEFLAYFQKI